MNILLVVAHPNPASFNHAIADACRSAIEANGHRVAFHDLYQERFDPVLPFGEFPKGAALPPAIRRHCEDLAAADGIVIVHPNWWGQPPAILKGWVDRVIRPGVAYEFREGDMGDGIPRGLLRARCAVIFNTSNTPAVREQTVFGDPLELVWRSCIFGLCGVPAFHRRTFSAVVTSTQAERKQWLAEAAASIDRFFPRDAGPG